MWHLPDRLPCALFGIIAFVSLSACGDGAPPDTASVDATPVGQSAGQSAVADETSMPNVVRIAAGSKDHTTLVAALTAAGLVDPLANPGPFTVFAPTNAAFDLLPAGALDDLLKAENRLKLKAILHHHVTTSSRTVDDLEDGAVLGMVDGTSETIRKSADSVFIGGARVVASVRASNGVVHIIDAVLLPK